LFRHGPRAARIGAVSRKDLRMEWDQIAEKWAAMTHRLCGDRIMAPRNTGPLEIPRATKQVAGETYDKSIPETIGTDRSLPTNQ
jgi:hypothetical protein